MTRALFPLLALILVLPAAAAAPVIPARPDVPGSLLRATGADDLVVGLAEARALLRNQSTLPFMSYPGQREHYLGISEGKVDVTRVDADVTLDIDQDGPLFVTSTVTFVALDPDLDKLEFYLEFPELTSLTIEPPLPMSYKKTGDIVKVEFSEEVPVEEELTLTWVYQGEMDCEVQFMLPTCDVTGPWRYVTHSRFLPYQSDSEMFVGTVRLHITGDGFQEWHAGGTGTYAGTTLDLDTGTKTITFEHLYPTSLFAWSASKMVTVHGMAGEIPISATVQNPQADNMGTILDIMQSVLSFYNSIYVDYPWNNLDLVAMPKNFSGGFGPLSTIFVTKGVLDATWDNSSIYNAMTLISHETGHEWWGNLVEMADATAIVLSEGLAEFSSNYHLERTVGSRWGFITNNMTYAYTVPHDQEPILISPFVYSSDYYYQVAYQKGASVFDMLRLELGDDVLEQALEKFSTDYYMEYAYPEDLFTLLEEVSGKDLTPFWNQWLAGRGIIILTIGGDCLPGADACRLLVSQESQSGQDRFQFNLPLHVLARDGSAQDVTLRVDEWEQSFDLPAEPGQVRRLYPDLRRQLVRIFRPMLPGDLDLNGVVDGADLVEMSFAFHIDLLASSDWGEYFFANGSYNELADLATEEEPGHIDGRIDDYDLAVLLEAIGDTMADVMRSR